MGTVGCCSSHLSLFRFQFRSQSWSRFGLGLSSGRGLGLLLAMIVAPLVYSGLALLTPHRNRDLEIINLSRHVFARTSSH